MKKIAILIFIFFLSSSFSKEPVDASNADVNELYGIAIKNVNFSSPISEDSIIQICLNLKARQPDLHTKYIISEIEINSLCLKGDMGLAMNKANIMYEHAKDRQNQLGIGLAFQAIGETYLHSNQFKQADDSFNEASKHIDLAQVPYAQLRLLIQQMHVCMELNNMDQLQKNIYKAIDISSNIKEQYKNDINFYILCYQTLHAIGTIENKLAGEYIRKALEIKFSHNHYDVWRYYINSRYYELIGNHEHALIYNDSVLQCLQHRNPNAYIKFSIHRAGIYEKRKDLKRACEIYEHTNILSDSLNVTQSSSQIDSLRITYLVDPMKVENAISYNKMYRMIIIYGVIILIAIIIIIVLTKKKNRLLHESQQRLDQKRNEADDSIQSKSMFISKMNHELRAPLNTIVSFSRLLADSYKGNNIDKTIKQQCTEVINQNSELLLKHLDNISNVSDNRSKIILFDWQECDIVGLCRSISNSITKEINPSVIFHFNTNLSNLMIKTDRNHLKQIITKVLTNAIKFTTNGYITFQLNLSREKNRDHIVFVVEDTGCGIASDKQSTIFQYSDNESGLPFCQHLLSQMGGKIWLDSSYTHGARFVFTHPIKQEDPKTK